MKSDAVVIYRCRYLMLDVIEINIAKREVFFNSCPEPEAGPSIGPYCNGVYPLHDIDTNRCQ